MSLTDQFTEKKIQRNLACFLAPEAEYSPEQFEEMKKPFYGIMDSAKLKMNDKTEILFFTEETSLLMQLLQTINEDSVVEALGGLYYHLSQITGSDILDSRNLMMDPEYIYFDHQNCKIFFIYLPIRTDGEPLRTGKFPGIGEKLAAKIDERFGPKMPPALKVLREALNDDTLSASEIFARINAVHPIRAAEEGEKLKAGMETGPAVMESVASDKKEWKVPGADSIGEGKDIPKNDRKGALKINMGKRPGPTGVADGDGTVIEKRNKDFTVPKIIQLTLTSPDTGQQIMIEQNALVIGRRAPEAMGVLQDAPKTVGRMHAEISRSGDGFFIRDLNSRNGTMLNGRLLPPNELTPLNDGDKVSLAKFELDVRVNEI